MWWCWPLSSALPNLTSKTCLLVSHQHLSQARETNPSGSPLRSQNTGCTFHSSLFLPREKLGVGSFLPTLIARAMLGRGWAWDGWKRTFLSASGCLFLALHSPGMLQPLNWFRELSQGQVGTYVMVKSVPPWGNEDLKLPIPPFCWCLCFCSLKPEK